MSDQADRLRKLVRETVKQRPALAPGVPLVVVSGGKGGVGVSTVATQLVHELAALGKRAVLVDANPLQPDIAARMGMDVSDCLADVLDGSRSAAESLRPLGDSVMLLPGRWASESPPDLSRGAINRLVGELRTLHKQADVVVLDVGCGMSPWVQQLWKSAQQILLVSTDESAAVMDSYAAVKLSPWGDVDGKLRLVVNQCDTQQLARTVGKRFEATCRRFLGIRVCPATHVATRPDIVDTVTQREQYASEQEFRQSVRLLAAEVMSTSLASINKATTSSEHDGSPASAVERIEKKQNNCKV
ncbi:MAG: P-loop NTPase [Planctomycetota bacterium]